jgi:hypothetical protein
MNRRDFLKALASLPALAALAHVPQVVLPAEAQNIDGAVAADVRILLAGICSGGTLV